MHPSYLYFWYLLGCAALASACNMSLMSTRLPCILSCPGRANSVAARVNQQPVRHFTMTQSTNEWWKHCAMKKWFWKCWQADCSATTKETVTFALSLCRSPCRPWVCCLNLVNSTREHRWVFAWRSEKCCPPLFFIPYRRRKRHKKRYEAKAGGFCQHWQETAQVRLLEIIRIRHDANKPTWMAIHFQCLPPKFLGPSARQTSFSTLLLICAGGGKQSGRGLLFPAVFWWNWRNISWLTINTGRKISGNSLIWRPY